MKHLKVVCINPRGSTKLIKGATYNVSSLHTSNYRSGQYRGVYIDGIGGYSADCFTLLNGDSLNTMVDFNSHLRDRTLDPLNKDYTGKYLRCRYTSSKSLKPGEIYYVEKQVVKEKKVKSYYNGQITIEKDVKFKMRGIKNALAPRNFEELSEVELRSIKLHTLKGDPVKTGDQTRKFLLYSEKEKISILTEIFNRVLTDLAKTDHTNIDIDIVKMIIKRGSVYNIIAEDVEDFLSISLREHLKKFNIS